MILNFHRVTQCISTALGACSPLRLLAPLLLPCHIDPLKLVSGFTCLASPFSGFRRCARPAEILHLHPPPPPQGWPPGLSFNCDTGVRGSGGLHPWGRSLHKKKQHRWHGRATPPAGTRPRPSSAWAPWPPRPPRCTPSPSGRPLPRLPRLNPHPTDFLAPTCLLGIASHASLCNGQQ